MQAQAAGASGGQSILQNPKVQIGIVAAGVIALIVVIWLLFFNSPSSSGTETPNDMSAMGNTPDMAMGGANGPATTGTSPDMSMGISNGPMMTAPAGGANPFGGTPGAAPAPPTEGRPTKQAPGVPSRTNPFRANTEMAKVLGSVPVPPQFVPMAQAHNIYVEELRTPDPPEVAENDDQGGPPIPPMRVAGIVHGSGQLSALIQMGDVFMDVAPGQMIPKNNPVYRVDQIHTDKVVLSRRWELGSRKGVQRIEVALAHGAAPSYAAPTMPGMGGRFPGMGAGGNGPGGNGPR